MAKAKQLPSGNWRVLVFDGLDAHGKRKYQSFTASTAKEAEYMALEYTLKKKRADKPENMTVGDAIDRYIESKDAVLSPSTIREYKRMRKAYMQNLIDVKLSKITPELVQREMNRESKNHSPKTIRNIHGLLSVALKIYYPDILVESLKKSRQEKGFVVHLTPNSITNRFAKILSDLNIPHFRFHDLRHYNASIMLALGIPDKYAMEIMGHATNNMLKNVYQHTFAGEKEKAVNKINSHFNETIKKE